MPKLPRPLDPNNWLPPLSLGKSLFEAKKIIIRWKNKDGSTTSCPQIEIDPDKKYIEKMVQAAKISGAETFRIETIDESGKQIGSETFSQPAPPPDPTEEAMIDQPTPQILPSTPPAPPAPPSPPTPIQSPTRLPVDELQATALANTTLAKLLESTISANQRTTEKLLDTNIKLADSVLKEKSGSEYVGKIIEMMEAKDKALERAAFAEAALAVESGKKEKDKSDPIKSATDMFNAIKNGPSEEVIVSQAIKAMKEGRTTSIIEALKKITYEERIEAIAGLFILCAKATPEDKHAGMLQDAIALVQKKANSG